MTDKLTIVRVELSDRSYDIQIGAGHLEEAGPFIASRARLSRAVLVSDTNVAPLYAGRVAESLRKAGAAVELVVIEAGEASKSLETAGRLWRRMAARGADRKSIVVALGGGVVGDLAGLLAATYARGVPFVQIPTSLLAQVDSSVGGKVGINLPEGKNLVGAFWQPIGVLIDTDVFATLPEREYRAGLGEVVKYGVILDADFFAYLERNAEAINARRGDVLRRIVARCCQLKAEVVAGDERDETGRRAVLNYGHTFCHALESVTGYGRFRHGEAVAIGMLCASRLAERLGRVGGEFTERQRRLLAALGLPVDVPELDDDALLAAMQRDKKVEHGQLRLVLPARMGCVELEGGVDVKLVREALRGGGGRRE